MGFSFHKNKKEQSKRTALNCLTTFRCKLSCKVEACANSLIAPCYAGLAYFAKII